MTHLSISSQLKLRVFRRRALAWLSLFVPLSMTGCGDSEVPRQTWTPLSDEDVVSSLGSPTGKFATVPQAEVIAEIETRLPSVVEAARFIGHLATVVAQASDDDLESKEADLPAAGKAPETTEDTAWATNLYLRIACPGLSIDPPFSFEHGEVRLDSPQLLGLDFAPLLKEGNFLLSFSQCELGPFIVDTQLAGRYFTDSSNLISSSSLPASDRPAHVLALNAQTENAEGTLGVIGIACGSPTQSCADLIRVAAEIDTGDEGTYVIAFELTKSYFLSPGSISLTVRGADSESSCEATGGAEPMLSCTSN